MKYSEFKNNVKLIGFETKESNRDIYVERIHETVISVSKEFRFDVDTGWTGFSKEQENVLLALYAHACELAKTPLAEREEEKRYWLQKIPVPLLDKNGEKKWLWKYTGTAHSNMFGTDTTKIDRELYKTIFTESEISKMDITGFEKIEVVP